MSVPVSCLGVVPVGLDNPGHPRGSAALRELDGVPLVRRGLIALVGSAHMTRVVVTCPLSLQTAVTDAMGELHGSDITVVSTEAAGMGQRVDAALGESEPSDIVVVHDPLHALAATDLVREVVRALVAAPSDVIAAVPIRAVIDTLKWVGPDDVVLGTVDRDGFRMVYSPQAYRGASLRAALARADDESLAAVGADALPRLMHTASGRVATVHAPAEVFRISTADDLALAEAMLHAGVG